MAGEALGSVSGAVAFGVGAVWAVFGDSTLARIDPSTSDVTETFVESSAPAALVVVDPHRGSPTRIPRTCSATTPPRSSEGPLGRAITVGLQPRAIAWGEGALWVANTGDDTVSRVDPGTGAAPPIRVGDEPVAVAVGAGAVWVANAGDGTISRIDPGRSEVVETIETGNAPSGIALWATTRSGFSVQSP